jgi:crossover junction endodeoxyribonuclease RuvC
MLVIGIDPGTATTGYGLVKRLDDGSMQAVAHGVIRTEAGSEMPGRLLSLYYEMQRLLRLHQPHSGAVEKLFFQRNVSTAMTVGQARGVVMLAMAEAGLGVAEYGPRQVKQAITGYGAAGKRQMQLMVMTLLGMDGPPHPDDAADALAVAICHMQHTRVQTLLGAER